MPELRYQYEYPRPAVAVDLIVVRDGAESRELLLIERRNKPFQGNWALPGGFMEIDETLAQAAARELREETGLTVTESDLVQLAAYSQIDRDPRTRVVSVVHFIHLSGGTEVAAGDDAADAKWFSVDSLPDLAFDHGTIIADWDAMIQSGVDGET